MVLQKRIKQIERRILRPVLRPFRFIRALVKGGYPASDELIEKINEKLPPENFERVIRFGYTLDYHPLLIAEGEAKERERKAYTYYAINPKNLDTSTALVVTHSVVKAKQGKEEKPIILVTFPESLSGRPEDRKLELPETMQGKGIAFTLIDHALIVNSERNTGSDYVVRVANVGNEEFRSSLIGKLRAVKRKNGIEWDSRALTPSVLSKYALRRSRIVLSDKEVE